MSRTYLITGGAGFIGSHLCDALLADGHRVLVVDDLSTGSLANLAQHEGNPRLEVRVGSVIDQALLEPLAARVDAIFHLAAVVGVGKVMESPIATIETSTRGMDSVAKCPRCCSQASRNRLGTAATAVMTKNTTQPVASAT